MKVLHLGKFEPDAAGGIETVQRLHERYLRTKIEWFSINFTKQDRRRVGKTFMAFPCIMLSSQPISLGYIWAAMKNFKKYDLVHIHLPNFLALGLSLMVRPDKLVIHWHSDVIGKGLLSRLLRPVEKWLVSRATHVVFTSEAYLEASYIDHPGAEVIPLSIDYRVGEPVQSQVIVDDNSEFRFLSVGRLVNYKNYDDLIQQFKRLPSNWKLAIVGSGPDKKILKSRISSLDLNSRVELLGYLSSAELEERYRTSDALILWSNSRAEAYGLVLLEAYARGLPLIVYKNIGSGMVDIVEQTRFSLSATDLSTSKEEIDSLLSVAIREQIEAEAETLFSPKVEIQSWLALYKRMMNQ